MEKISVSLDHIISEFSLEVFHLPCEAKDIKVICSAVNRPGLQITGYYDHFEEERIQIIGHVEHDYLLNLPDEERAMRVDEFFAHKPVAVVVSTDLTIFPELMNAAKAQYMSFLTHILPMLPSGALLITDNVLQEGSIVESKYSITRRDRTIHMRMREYLYELKHNDALTTSIVAVGDGMALSVKR